MKPLISHFTDNDLYTFTCQYYVLKTYPRAEVEYSFIDRNNTVYPAGFAELLQEQVNYMKDVVITDEEIAFMTEKCVYLPLWYFTFLRGYRFNPAEVFISQDAEGHLSITVHGMWFSTIMWEMPLLSCISELMHILRGDIERYDAALEESRARSKAEQIFAGGLILGDMGTRRRLSFDHQEMVIRVMKEVADSRTWPGKFTGTSNVWLAMKYNCSPLGTMSHQLISFEENVSGVFECNYAVMKKFSDVFDGDNGIYLYDCFGDKVFFSNLSKRMAMMYKGLRVDSGNEEEQIEKIIAKYKELGIDPATKQVVFSNGLNIERALQIHAYCAGRVLDSYGVGTFLTCDVTGCSP
ncbi:MAG: nicotinate phosphoribosyltransferase, partial [Bacteroidales bacterium]|nr:nicotinate phosphoribosyltransferase [Bacteroidales bacterium]